MSEEPGPFSSVTRTVARVRTRITRQGKKMAQITPNVGIDVSKEWLDVAVYPGGEHFRTPNDARGWREVTRRLMALGPRAIGIEASGGYERDVIAALAAHDLPVRGVNAWKLRQFAKAVGVLAKNDRLDAYVIAWFVATLPCREVRHNPALVHLAELVTARRQALDAKLRLSNQLEHLRDPELRRLRQRRIRQLEADERLISTRIAAAIAADAGMAERHKLIVS
ncbi:MAG: IS110 family transposase, partial [Pseudomonadota bacterium]